MASIVPFAQAMTLCDFHVGYGSGKVDLYGLFNTIRPHAGYPHTHARFCVFAQLVNGLGILPFHVDVRCATRDELIWTSGTNELSFATRNSIVRVAVTVEDLLFAEPGLYLLKLFCDNRWVCDTQLRLR